MQQGSTDRVVHEASENDLSTMQQEKINFMVNFDILQML